MISISRDCYVPLLDMEWIGIGRMEIYFQLSDVFKKFKSWGSTEPVLTKPPI